MKFETNTLCELRRRYLNGDITPQQEIDRIFDLLLKESDQSIWVSFFQREQLYEFIRRLDKLDIEHSPLWGIPFAVKDNIDVAGLPTTAACPEYAYSPTKNATVVQKLIDAGAIPIGKTNMDQFATGLVGTRSPFGATKNSFDPSLISGGSSSGSAVSVAKGYVSFALGTDTAGSGRVPAAFNNIFGTKPTRGRLSTSGVVPACRSLDCVTFFTLTREDSQTLLTVASEFDETDPYSREVSIFQNSLPGESFRFAVPMEDQLIFFGNDQYQNLFNQAVETMEKAGGIKSSIDFTPFFTAAKLLYEGSWVAERYVAIEDFLQQNSENILPVIKNIIGNADQLSAVKAFKDQYNLQAIKKSTDSIFQDFDCLVTPTAPTIYSIEQVNKDPINLNSNLGTYTNYMNLLDYCGIAIPAGFTESGIPFGITLVAPAFHDEILQQIAHKYFVTMLQTKTFPKGAIGASMEAPLFFDNNRDSHIDVAVCGAHLTDMPLNWQLIDRNATLKASTRTSSNYRMYALAGGPPYRPGLIRDENKGSQIDVEVWSVPTQHLGSFVAGIPAPLGIGKVELENKAWVSGFICEPIGLEGAKEITSFASWRNYIRSI